MKKIRFYIKQYKESPPAYIKYPSLVLVPNTWNDYGFYVTFKLYYYQSFTDRTEIGDVKILDITSHETNLPNSFNLLGNKHCSLGQSLDYYENIKRFFPTNYLDILDMLNDVAVNVGLRTEFEPISGFKEALLRATSAEKAYKEARFMLEGRKASDRGFNFKFKITLPGASQPHLVDFNFEKNANIPYRINVLIGKNGTGKTQLLSNMINTITGLDNKGIFSPTKPIFSNYIAISYSIFYKFPKPQQTSKFNYSYIGLRTDDDEMIDDDKINRKLRQALREIRDLDRQNEWMEFVGMIIDLDKIDHKDFALTDSTINKIIAFKSTLSSGQNIIFFILTGLIATIRKDSLILFDEPETHLHPSAIALLIKIFYDIIKFYNSYAVIATHSPIILQDVPAKCISVFDRIGDVPLIRKLPLESFGENISTLTNTVFETSSVKELYKEYLEKLAGKKSIDQILQLFDNKLSINAQLFLAAITQ